MSGNAILMYNLAENAIFSFSTCNFISQGVYYYQVGENKGFGICRRLNTENI